MSDSGSIFDSIKVSGALPISGGRTPGLPGAAGGAGQQQAYTGLLAALSASEFGRIVGEALDPVVLRTQFRTAPNGGAGERKKAGSPPSAFRYVFPCAGIVFITTSVTQLALGDGVHEISCLAVLHEGKPLGRDDAAL